MGLILSRFEWDWGPAEGSYLKALELYPGDPIVNQRYGIFLCRLGRHAEAVEAIRRARDLDPLSLTISNAVGVVLHMAGRYDEAIEQYRRNLELSESYYRTQYNLGRSYLELSQYEDAVTALDQARAMSGDRPYLGAMLGTLTAARDKPDGPKRFLRKFPSAVLRSMCRRRASRCFTWGWRISTPPSITPNELSSAIRTIFLPIQAFRCFINARA